MLRHHLCPTTSPHSDNARNQVTTERIGGLEGAIASADRTRQGDAGRGRKIEQQALRFQKTQAKATHEAKAAKEAIASPESVLVLVLIHFQNWAQLCR